MHDHQFLHLSCKLPGNPKGFDIDNLCDPKTFPKNSLPSRLLKRGNNRPTSVQQRMGIAPFSTIRSQP